MGDESNGSNSDNNVVEEIPINLYVVGVPKNKNIDLLELIRIRKDLLGLGIYSAVILEEHPDLVYIEADDFLSVAKAVEYFRYVKLVEEPLSPLEVKNVLSAVEAALSREREVEEKKVEFEVGQIVRIIRGPFKDKKARIVSVSKNKLFVDLMSGATLLIEVDPDDVEIAD